MNKDIMRNGGFGDWIERVEMGDCPICFEPINLDDFKDEISLKEFQITGMCQYCQDNFFAEE